MNYPDVYFPDKISFEENEIDKKTYSAHRLNSNFLMPAEPSVMFFCGMRGSGKTTAMLNLIDQFDYDTLSIFSSTIQQPKFQQIIRGFLEYQDKTGVNLSDRILIEKDLSAIIDGSFIASRDPSMHHLVIIDDFAVSDDIKSSAFGQILMNGRPANISALISTQDFHIIPKKLRGNITHYAFFRGMIPLDIKTIARNYINDLTPEQFLTMYNYAMNFKEAGGRPFLLFDKMTDIPKLRYRINFDFLLN